MEPDEDVASNVQMIFQWASEGNTATEITRKLYAMNIPTPGEYRKLKGKAYYNVSLFYENSCIFIYGKFI